MKLKTAISIGLLALAPMAAHAQKIFMCKDASGRTLTSDRPIPECGDRTVKELDKHGVVRKEVAPPLTAEEKAKIKAAEEKKKADAIAADEKKRNDRALLARFRSEADIAAARKRDVDLVQDQIKRESGTIATHEKRKKEAQAQLPAAKEKSVQANLNKAIEDYDQSIASNKRKIQEYEAEIAQINQKYDATLARFRELTPNTASASAPTPTPAPAAK